ncbi:MAG: phosphoribosylformylglycinamidine synthase subunit PurQ [Candidatus Diapherotrites archaeon]|nr:phosphoribosylformylglycinamidine synthase subunit PurQ [Candidatus Diapherotrites archaeon]
MTVKVLVLSGYGINSETESKYVFDLLGAKAEIVHINDLISGEKKLNDYRIIFFPGGFAYGDDLGSGLAYANKIKNNLWNEVKEFVEKDNLVIAVCNGFQIMANLGLVPAFDSDYGKVNVALQHNETARYIDRWVDIKANKKNKSIWLKDIDELSMPVSHGEGKFYAEPEILDKLEEKGLIAFNYVKGNICNYQNLKANPNGSLKDIAGITDESGRILGMMPHPERGFQFTNRPDWPLLKEKLKRNGKKLPEFNDSMKIFENAVNYFK